MSNPALEALWTKFFSCDPHGRPAYQYLRMIGALESLEGELFFINFGKNGYWSTSTYCRYSLRVFAQGEEFRLCTDMDPGSVVKLKRLTDLQRRITELLWRNVGVLIPTDILANLIGVSTKDRVYMLEVVREAMLPLNKKFGSDRIVIRNIAGRGYILFFDDGTEVKV